MNPKTVSAKLPGIKKTLYILMRILFTSSCGLKDVVQSILFAMPNLILYASPMACLLGVMLAFVRLNGDNELIAFRAAGTGFLGFLPPVLGVLTLITALSLVNAVWLLPTSNRAFDGKLRSLGRVSIPSLLEEGVFISDIPKLVFFFRTVDHAKDKIKGIFVQDQREPNQEVTIAAESAKIDFPPDSRAIIFRLSNGMITLEYVRQERLAGETKYPLKKMVRLALDGILSFSQTPLKVSSLGVHGSQL